MKELGRLHLPLTPGWVKWMKGVKRYKFLVINKSWGYNVQLGDSSYGSVLYICKLLRESAILNVPITRENKLTL